MINKNKCIAVFTCQVTMIYRKKFCETINIVARDLGYNVVYFNFIGLIGNRHHDYGDYEYKLVDVIPYGEFDGIIFDEEAFTVDGMVDKLVDRIKKKAHCPVVSVTSYMKDFYNVLFDDASGIELMAKHLYEEHGCRRIAFLSGPLHHHDGFIRYEAFKKVMSELGLPEEGAGIFEGDFWFHSGRAAADHFLSPDRERPEAVICANDYMAMSLVNALKERGIEVPEDIIVTGFDGTDEGQKSIPKLTTVDRQRNLTAETAVKIIDRINRGEECPKTVMITASIICADTCGCTHVNYKLEVEKINRVTEQYRQFNYYLSDVTAATLKMNIVDSIQDLERSFAEHAVNFGGYSSFFLMIYVNESGRPSYEKGTDMPTNRVYPAMMVDRDGEYTNFERRVMDIGEFLPQNDNDEPKAVYVMSMHCGDRCFGYSAITMTGSGLFNEFYNVWIATLAVALESLLRRNNILELVNSLEDTSVRDELTGLYNRRGFERLSSEAVQKLGRNEKVCAIVIDIDGLKRINDYFGHSEGDLAIRKIAEFIDSSGVDGMIAGRTGGDEFYIFAPNCDEARTESFRKSFEEKIERFNAAEDKPYMLDASFGAYVREISEGGNVEELIRIADERMYAVKQRKKQSRNG